MRSQLHLRGNTRFIVLLAVVLALFLQARICSAQDRSYPKTDYFIGFAPFHDGEYVTAAAAFRSASRGGLRSTEGRWIDSICYHTMVGECLFRMGDHANALDQFNAACRLYLQHRNWMLRVEFPGVVGPSTRGPRPAISWGVSKRLSRPAQIPPKLLTLQGGVDQAVGVVAPLENYPIYATEIVRCTALALHRRMEIMGPTCPHDRLTGQLVAALTLRPAPPNHWSQTWIDAMLGMAYASAGKYEQAVAELQKSLVLGGQYDHPLTSLSLLTLGKLAFDRGQYNVAANFFYEATFPAAAYEQFDILEEAFRWGARTHTVGGQQGLYPALATVGAWARKNSRALEVSASVAGAENLTSSGDAAGAARLLEQARRAMGRTEMATGAVGARMNYQVALSSFQRGNLAPGTQAFEAAMKYQANSSLRLFQINLADRLYTSGAISDRIADMLYSGMLDDPQPKHWLIDPMETITTVLTPAVVPMEHWFEVAIQRKEHEKALEIADRIRRRRFFATLPMGGRLLALRWILEAPDAALSDTAKLQRRDIKARYPVYEQLSRQSQVIRRQLELLPLAPEDDEQRKKIKSLLSGLGEISGRQELILREIALQRDASEFVFPPKLNFKQLQKSLPEGQLVLSFFSTTRYVYAFLFSKDKYAHWPIEAPAKVRAEIRNVLKEMGHHDKNQALSVKDLEQTAWRESAKLVFAGLTNNTGGDVWDQFDELVVVPDGVLWYLPFDSMQIAMGEKTVPLISKVRIRYAPTVSLSAPDGRGHKPNAKTGVVASKLFPREEDEQIEQSFRAIGRALPGSARVQERLDAPSFLMATRFDRLIVMADVEAGRSVYDWAPMVVDRGKPGSGLGAWFQLPWGGPTQIVLPGFHTLAENGLKKGGTGNEVFLTACALMSTGARTALISRWRVGGQTSRNLIREFVQELPYAPASLAWQRSVQLSRANELDPDVEPRVNRGPLDKSLQADHPFFWSGYLLLDTGSSPRRAPALPAVAAPAVPAAPKAAPKPPAAPPALPGLPVPGKAKAKGTLSPP